MNNNPSRRLSLIPVILSDPERGEGESNGPASCSSLFPAFHPPHPPLFIFLRPQNLADNFNSSGINAKFCASRSHVSKCGIKRSFAPIFSPQNAPFPPSFSRKSREKRAKNALSAQPFHGFSKSQKPGQHLDREKCGLSSIAKYPIALLCLSLLVGAAFAQTGKPAAKPANLTVPALLLSDIHFEPFWDPAKVAQLDGEPVAKWNGILAPPPSSDQQQRFAALQQACPTKGTDTSYTLFQSSLDAMRANAAGVGFVTVSGDLISHAFHCKYFTLFPKATPAEYKTFVEKTITYVVDELDASFPKTPIYVALGNNDSSCEDYLIDAGSDFLKETGVEVTKNFPTAERQDAQTTFADEGYYGVSLPAPIQNARLLVLDDLFMSKSHRTCAGALDPQAAAPQIAWLGKQLADARAHKQKVWVMGHIPPGVDLYSTEKKMIDFCAGQKPVMFLSSEEMADVISGYGDVVQLAIFAHTHMDELRLLKDESAGAPSKTPVPVKMISSISPIHKNLPSFTIAQVDPASAALVDYRVFSSSNLTGVSAKWTEEYDFRKSYTLPDFSSASVGKLTAEFAADPGGTGPASQDYLNYYDAGSYASALQVFWPQYVCSLSNHTVQAFAACACANAH
ncbi:MAG: metallophosphoesterase [Terracidiphilus sp.]